LTLANRKDGWASTEFPGNRADCVEHEHHQLLC
jgi:hypothetical protein